MKKSYTKTLTANGGLDVLQFIAVASKTGASAYTIHRTLDPTDKKKTTSRKRGGSFHADSIEAAIKTFEPAIAAALRQGWAVSVPNPRGYKAPADAFTLDSLPAPRKTAAASAAPKVAKTREVFPAITPSK